MLKQHRPPSKAKLAKIVEGFNRKFPVGTPVILRKDSGEIGTIVRAPGEILSGHSAVAWFAGVTGAYSIEDKRVRSPKDSEMHLFECASCRGYGHFDEDGKPSIDRRGRKCLDCTGTGRTY